MTVGEPAWDPLQFEALLCGGKLDGKENLPAVASSFETESLCGLNSSSSRPLSQNTAEGGEFVFQMG